MTLSILFLYRIVTCKTTLSQMSIFSYLYDRINIHLFILVKDPVCVHLILDGTIIRSNIKYLLVFPQPFEFFDMRCLMCYAQILLPE